jgi:PAS domain S-box-containing protein
MNTKKLLIIILILLSIAPLFVSHTLIFLQEEVINNNTTKQLNAIANIQHKRIQQYINNKRESVRLISANTQLKNSIIRTPQKTNSDRNITNIVNDIFAATSDIENIIIYSVKKNILYSTVDNALLSHYQLSNPHYEFKDNTLNIEVHQKKEQSITIEIVEPLLSKSNIIGYISVEFSANELISILNDYNGLGNTGEIILAAKNDMGHTQFLTPTRHNSNFPLSFTVDKNNQSHPITYAMNGKSAILKGYVDYRHVPVLAISRFIPETHWGMIVKIDYDEVFHQHNNLKTVAIIFTLIFLIIIIVIATYLSRKLPDPIYTLENITDLIKEGDAQIKTPHSFSYEIDKLGNAFNSMMSLLPHSESYLRNSVEKLTQANLVLLAEAKRFKRWKESKFIGIIHSDDSGRVIDANEALLNMIGYTKDELNAGNIDWLKLTPTECHHLDKAAIAEADEKGYWTPFEKAYIHKEGHHVPILIGGSIFQHDVKEYIVFVVDLSDRNKKIDELTKYKGIIENSRDLFAFVNTDYHFKTVNPAYLHAYGLQQDQVINKSIADVLGKEYFENETKKSIDSVLAGKTLSFVKTQIFKAIGKRDIMVTYTPYRDSKNNIIGLIYKGEDITQLQKQRKLIDLQVAEHEQIVASMLEGIITTDENGIILSFNPEASSIFGYSEHEVLGKNVSILMPEKHAKHHSHQMFNYLRSKNSSFVGNRLGREVMALHKDKHTFPLRISVAELPSIEGDKNHFIANCQDLTEIEQQKEMLNRTLRMESLGKVSGGIAHDFNNLLGIIIGYNELLKMKVTKEDDKKYLSGISLACERGTKLTKSLLTFSKYQPSEAKAYCINTIILDNQRMLETMLTTKVSLTFNLANALFTTEIDKSLFEDMLLNFSINALQAMEGGGKLSIKTNNKVLNNREADLLNLPSGNYVKLTIKDSGCGINEETLLKIYDPFFTTKEELGNGLGLYQCYGFVKSSHGAINVKSTVDKGTTFDIYFPEISNEKSEIKFPEKSILIADNFRAEQWTILIVDDEADIRYLNAKFLTSAGFKVHSCENASKALEILKNENIDFIITDVVMPKMGGVEFIKQAKRLKPEIKYLFVSGYLDIKDSNEADLIKPILYKPYKAENLIENIKLLLRQ